ncbi:MAG: hypothetical protein HQK50_09675 [Oligoflexia bacterium]|nr:hypothetical protein [Oligoflexia bacterium]MBF0365831.1 hypothetical protein [Oligoflexia bacterium]
MEGLYYLVVDQELKGLLEKVATHHPEASKGVLKLILKMYLKLADKSKRKGKDPLIAFQNLVESVMGEKPCETTREKIEYLDTILEEKDPKNSSSHYSNSSVVEDIKEIKSLIKEIRGFSRLGSAQQLVENFRPTGPSELIELQQNNSSDHPPEPKKKKNFKDIRRDKMNKVVKF